MASREREGEEVEEEEEGDGENGGKRRIKEKGATAGHVSPGLPACLPITNPYPARAHSPPPHAKAPGG